jgi:hypothetical protein
MKIRSRVQISVVTVSDSVVCVEDAVNVDVRVFAK